MPQSAFLFGIGAFLVLGSKAGLSFTNDTTTHCLFGYCLHTARNGRALYSALKSHFPNILTASPFPSSFSRGFGEPLRDHFLYSRITSLEANNERPLAAPNWWMEELNLVQLWYESPGTLISKGSEFSA
jgi:hypothetical protein